MVPRAHVCGGAFLKPRVRRADCVMPHSCQGPYFPATQRPVDPRVGTAQPTQSFKNKQGPCVCASPGTDCFLKGHTDTGVSATPQRGAGRREALLYPVSCTSHAHFTQCTERLARDPHRQSARQGATSLLQTARPRDPAACRKVRIWSQVCLNPEPASSDHSAYLLEPQGFPAEGWRPSSVADALGGWCFFLGRLP